MNTPFSRTFVRLRKEAGFETAYQFFHKNGGAKIFQCSFPNYLRIEKGSHLPQPRRLPLLCTLLRLPLKSDELRELVSSFLETWIGTKDLADWFLAPFSVRDVDGTLYEPAQQALHKLVRESAKPMSVAQYEAIMETPAAYWSYRVLTSSKEAYAPADLAALIDHKPAEVQKALEALRARRIVRKLRDGRYQSPMAGQMLLFPDPKLIPPARMDKVFKYNQSMVDKKGQLVDVRYFGTRVDMRKLQGYIPHFREAVRSVNAYSVMEKTDQSALVFVEGRIYKLFDF